MLQSNGQYALVRDEKGHESTISGRKLAKVPQGDDTEIDSFSCDDFERSSSRSTSTHGPIEYETSLIPPVNDQSISQELTKSESRNTEAYTPLFDDQISSDISTNYQTKNASNISITSQSTFIRCDPSCKEYINYMIRNKTLDQSNIIEDLSDECLFVNSSAVSDIKEQVSKMMDKLSFNAANTIKKK
ncbi:hypothetical protein GJ496_010563 [Pomphorhynchus laevis]|nr:hypothetical protein GJ496_010563 [Pomphorhynchus laevis]